MARREHAFQGGGLDCLKCGDVFWNHREPRKRERLDTRDRTGRIQERKTFKEFFGIDGEGVGRENHRYILLSLSNLDGSKKYSIQDYDGLSTQKCLEFLYDLPSSVRLFAFADNYDLTKILEDVDDEALYKLWRPEMRQRHNKNKRLGPKPVEWGGWYLNLQGTKFSIKKRDSKKVVVIWDIWKFYQCKFTKACRDWKVGTKEELDEMDDMKNQRSELDRIFREHPERVHEYNLKETMFMAELTTKLVEAHQSAGLELKTFYGAGSTATAILKLLEIDKYIAKGPPEMLDAIAKAYSGGRFDNSYIGYVPGPVYGYDLSSAYPYHISRLPCLKCGTWELTTDRKRILTADSACVHYRLRPIAGNGFWGPFPFREDNGNICYPSESGGGWVWREEYLMGEKYFDGVEFIEAWVYHTDCKHQPFCNIPLYYIERCRIGKEGPGIVIKLGCNSLYGKMAQAIGRAKYQSWIWAGMVTSQCRAQVLEAIGLHKDRKNLLMIATDGILTREKLNLPKPQDTGTFDVWECKKHKKTCYECSDRTYKPLGGWEEKINERGVFIARPGIYFPMNPTKKDLETVRARGVGRGVILNNWKAISDTWEAWDGKGDWPVIKVSNVGRFCGAKTSISRRVRKDKSGKPFFEYHRANGNHLEGDPHYGQWLTREVVMSFNPYPKREARTADGYLTLRRFTDGKESASYKKAKLSPEAKQLKAEQELLIEQPTGDYTFY